MTISFSLQDLTFVCSFFWEQKNRNKIEQIMLYRRLTLASATCILHKSKKQIYQTSSKRTFSVMLASKQAQGYIDDGKLDPKGKKPSQQGGSNIVKQKAEHPGPAPPAEGIGSGLGPTKGHGKEPGDISAQSGGSRSKEAKRDSTESK